MTLFDQIANEENLLKAWKEIKKSKLSHGIDNVTIAQFKESLDEHIPSILKELQGKDGYKFSGLRGVAIDKNGGKKRPIRVAIIKDRVVQKAICNAIMPIMESNFGLRNKASYAYIKARGLLDAVSDIQKLVKSGRTICYKGDIKNYFGAVDLDILLNKMVFPVLGEEPLMKSLITAALTQEVHNLEELRKKYGSKVVSEIFPDVQGGIPQGGILSPLFANVYLKDFDKALMDAGFDLIRYADDFIILCNSDEEAYAAEKIAKAETEKLKLELHPIGTKSTIGPTSNFEFLGIRFRNARMYPSDESYRRTSEKLKVLADPTRNEGKGLGARLSAVERLVRSWGTTYWFTSMGGRAINNKGYNELHVQLGRTIEKILDEYGLMFASKAKGLDKRLKKLGIRKFNASVQLTHIKIVSNPDKSKIAKLFYSEDDMKQFAAKKAKP